MSKENVLCSFCNQKIESDNLNPCDINILTNWDKPKSNRRNQTFWCHLECFRKRLHKEVQQHLVLHLLTHSEEI